jgi:hypothetical protein
MRLIKPWRNEYGCKDTTVRNLGSHRSSTRRQPVVVRRQADLEAKGRNPFLEKK